MATFPCFLWAFLNLIQWASCLPQNLQQSPNSTQTDLYEQEKCLSTSEELVSTLNGQLKCCKKCPVGEGMLQLCTNETQTICRPCQEGSEFSLEASATAKCVQCKQCQELHPFAKFRKHCTPTSDAVCECVSGYFFIEALSTCQSCTKCPPGNGAEKPCEWNQDSVCKPCPNGTWSAAKSAAEKCQTCRKCKPGQIEMRPCTATQNTLCCPLHNPNCEENYDEEDREYQDPSSIRKQGKYVGDQAMMTYGDDYPMITVYCSLLGLVILTLLIYVFYKLWQQRFSIEDSKSLEAGGFHPAFTGLKSVGNKARNCKTSGSTKNTFDHQHLLSEQQNQLQLQQHSYAPLSATISKAFLKDLALELSSEGRWKQVGGFLGFSEEELRIFENAKSKEDLQNSDDTQEASAQQLLTAWYSRSLATDPNPLLSLQAALERTPSAGNSCRRLREHLQPPSALLQVSQTETLPYVQTINH